MERFSQQDIKYLELGETIRFDPDNNRKRLFTLLPPGPPIVTSTWQIKPNRLYNLIPGIPESFFDRTGTHSNKIAPRKRVVWFVMFALRMLYTNLYGISSKETALAKRKENWERSMLYRLPVELLLLIGEQLPPLSQLCIRRVCSKFRICLEGLGPELRDGALLRTDVLKFSLLVKRDAWQLRQQQYNERCDNSDPDSKLYRRGCSGCRTTHRNLSAFLDSSSSQNFSLSPKERICIGLQGNISFCEHISFSAECLMKGLHDFRKLKLYCALHRRIRDSDGNQCITLEREPVFGPKMEYIDGAKITIDRRFYLFSAPLTWIPTRQELLQALHHVDGVICPHLRTSSSYFWCMKNLTAECPRGVKDDPDRGRGFNFIQRPCADLWNFQRVDRLCIFWSKCPNSSCNTWFGLRRLFIDIDPIHHIVLEVKRTFVGDPTHPSWKAQVESTESEPAVLEPAQGCLSRYGNCKGPICAARHDGIVVSPGDLDSKYLL